LIILNKNAVRLTTTHKEKWEMKKISLILLFLITALITGCNSKQIFKEFRSEHLTDMTWTENEKFTFKATIEDNTVPYNVILALRHIYPIGYQFITIKVTLVSPSGGVLSKPYKIQLINDDRTPVGETAGNISDIEMPIMAGLTLEKGSYQIEVTPQTTEDLVGIMEVGIIIEKSVSN